MNRHAPPPPALVSRIGDISPAFAAACGARVSFSIGFALEARNAEARALAAERLSTSRSTPAAGRAVPAVIATARTLPSSRVGVAAVIDPDD